jgi:NAD(P)-dependent dehydrogenase (short-subunit alcohol dehydrogenase family)
MTISLITGANKGIGYETAKQLLELGHTVYIGARDVRRGETAAAGVVRVTEAALPLLRKSANPNVVTISSSMGSFWAVTNPERPEHGMPLALYAASKAAATMLNGDGPTGTLQDEAGELRW